MLNIWSCAGAFPAMNTAWEGRIFAEQTSLGEKGVDVSIAKNGLLKNQRRSNQQIDIRDENFRLPYHGSIGTSVKLRSSDG